MSNKSRMFMAVSGALLFSSALSAQTITIGTANVSTGATSAMVPVTFTASGANPVAGYAATFSFTRDPAVAAMGMVTASNVDGSCGGPGVTTPTGTTINVGDLDLGLAALPSGTTCNLTFPLEPGAAAGNYPLMVTFEEFTDTGGNPTTGTTVPGAIIISAGPVDTPPTIAYNPTTGSTVSLPGGAGTIVATPSGGMGTGAAATTTVNGCAIGSVSGPGTFGSVAGVSLSFVGNTTTPQNINLSCTQGGMVTTGTLTCNETRGAMAPTVRSWPLSCPAGAAGTPPTLNYVPAPGSNVTFVGAPGTMIMSTIAVTGTGGTGSGASATARVSDCQISPALSPPVFACQPSGGNVLDFTPGGADPGDITCSCDAPSTGQLTANLTCEETRPLGTTPVVRQWSLTCPGTPGSCGTLVFSPNPGLIQFTGGTASIGISHTGGTMGNDTTFNGCGITGANASNFQISNAPINFSFTGGSTGSGQIDLACTNSTTAPVQATLSCSQVCDVNNTPRTWTLECPAGGTPPPTAEVVPVPSSSDFSRILLAAMLVLIGMAAVTIRGRS